MSSKRNTEDFKIEAVRQVVDRGYSVAEVAKRIGQIHRHSDESRNWHVFPDLIRNPF